MASIDIWPALGVTVVDENDDPIPTGGISVSWSEYYENLLRKGLVKTFDPTGLNGTPGPVEALPYDGLGLEYDPDNYTETSATIGGHLEGIDNALGSLEADIAGVQSDATQALSDAAAAQATADAAEVEFTFSSTVISGNTTLEGSDRSKILKTSGSGNHAISISGDGRHTANDKIAILHRGTGTPTIVGTGGMTVEKPQSTAASFFDQGSLILIIFESSTVCHLVGRLTPA